MDLKDPITARPKHLTNENPGVCCHGNSRLEKLEAVLLGLPAAQVSSTQVLTLSYMDRFLLIRKCSIRCRPFVTVDLSHPTVMLMHGNRTVMFS